MVDYDWLNPGDLTASRAARTAQALKIMQANQLADRQREALYQDREAQYQDQDSHSQDSPNPLLMLGITALVMPFAGVGVVCVARELLRRKLASKESHDD